MSVRRRPIRLGTRSSRLALWQAEKVAALLRGHDVECALVPIETRGDDVPDRPLPEIGGDGVFTERIERSLRASEIDIAVHSLKDLPVEDPGELCVGAVLGREEVREVLISRNGQGLASLAAGAVIGTSSTRRQAQLLSLRPDLVVRPIRGNIETRIAKVESGHYDATLLAGAGVLRLGLAGKIAEWLEISDILPAPGQGAIAVQCRTADQDTRSVLAVIDEPGLHAETDAERAFLRALGGGCSAPVGAYAQVRGSRLRLRGRVSALDGRRAVDVEGEGEDHAALVTELADRALRGGAAELIAAAGSKAVPLPAAGARAVSLQAAGAPLRGLRVLVTRAREQADDLCRMLAEAGAVPVVVPMIRIVALDDAAELDAAVEELASYDWLVFASRNGVEYFMNRLEAMRPGTRPATWPTTGAPRVAAVGPGTAAVLTGRGVNVDFVPEVHTGIALAQGLAAREKEGLTGARVLMPRALDGGEDAADFFRQNGAVVHEVPVYRTEPCAPSTTDLAALEDGVDAVLFTSSSAVDAWCSQASAGSRLAEAVRRAVIACIGPSTASTARGRGLHVDVEAAAHTATGLLEALARHFSHAVRKPA
jgi:hydroxymethylbilane synthase